jgi:hypothetical protein
MQHGVVEQAVALGRPNNLILIPSNIGNWKYVLFYVKFSIHARLFYAQSFPLAKINLSNADIGTKQLFSGTVWS